MPFDLDLEADYDVTLTDRARLYCAAVTHLALSPMEDAPKDRPLVVAALVERRGELRLYSHIMRYGDFEYSWGVGIWWPAYYMDAAQSFRPDEAIGWRLPTDAEDCRGGEMLLAPGVAAAMLEASVGVAA